MADITNLTDLDNEVIYPITVTEAVYDNNGNKLSDILDDIPDTSKIPILTDPLEVVPPVPRDADILGGEITASNVKGINIYVSEEGKLHFVDATGADTEIPFSGGKNSNLLLFSGRSTKGDIINYIPLKKGKYIIAITGGGNGYNIGFTYSSGVTATQIVLHNSADYHVCKMLLYSVEVTDDSSIVMFSAIQSVGSYGAIMFMSLYNIDKYDLFDNSWSTSSVISKNISLSKGKYLIYVTSGGNTSSATATITYPETVIKDTLNSVYWSEKSSESYWACHKVDIIEAKTDSLIKIETYINTAYANGKGNGYAILKIQ